MNNSNEPQVLFITMPWMTPIHPSLGLELLRSTLAEARIPSACLYGNLLLPRPTQETLLVLDPPSYYEDYTAGLSFVPHLYPHIGPEQVTAAIAQRRNRLMSREGHLDVMPYTPSMEGARFDIQAAGTCLDRCLEIIDRGSYDIIGFSLMFETQLIASLTLARRIKERNPDVRIVFGGAACTAGQGVALLRSFRWLDVVCMGEGDPVIVPLVQALRGNGDLGQIKGIAFRSGYDVPVNAKAPPLLDLDQIPLPDYSDYFAQKRVSDWADTSNMLPFETSRGCWWGEKHLCTFCGLNAETLKYRSKTAKRVMKEIKALADRWDEIFCLQATDNIFDMRYFKELVPLLIEYQRQRKAPIPIFFEIKSNLKRGHFFLLAAAGILMLQPGIESFNDHILQLMDKGATALQQITFVKWASQAYLSPTYNILMRNPGESVEDYHQMTEMLPYIKHLIPPHGIGNMQLQRYSPYFLQPEKFKLGNVRPHPHYDVMFPDPEVDVEQIVYEFDFDNAELDQPDLVAARRDFAIGLLEWKRDYKMHTLNYYIEEGDVVIVDRRDGGEERVRLSGRQAIIFSHIDQAHSFSEIAGRFQEIAPPVLRAFLESLVARRFAYHHPNDYYLALPIRTYNTSEYLKEVNEHLEALRTTVAAAETKKRRQLAIVSA